MLAEPSMIAFQTRLDIVDYVSRGLIPLDPHVGMVITKVRNPDTRESIPDKVGREVVISEDLFSSEREAEILAEVLERVHENRKRNRKITLGTIGVIGAACLIGSVFSSSNEKKKQEESYPRRV